MLASGPAVFLLLSRWAFSFSAGCAIMRRGDCVLVLRIIAALVLLWVGFRVVYSALDACGIAEPWEAAQEEKRREKRWKALQKELDEQETQEEKEE